MEQSTNELYADISACAATLLCIGAAGLILELLERADQVAGRVPSDPCHRLSGPDPYGLYLFHMFITDGLRYTDGFFADHRG